MNRSTPLSIDLRAAADALQAGIANPNLAIVLTALAAAVEKPTGYTLRLLGGSTTQRLSLRLQLQRTLP